MISSALTLAAKAGVTLIDGAEPSSYHSEHAPKVGDVRKIKSAGWVVVVAHERKQPGWFGGPPMPHYQAIACSPPPAELARLRRGEIERLVQQSPQAHDARVREQYQWDHTGMVECWGAHREAGHEVLWSDGVSRLIYETGHYDDGPAAWWMTDAALAVEVMRLKIA